MLIYLLGFPRSGTTLFQSLLTQNSLIDTRPETNLVGRRLTYMSENKEILDALIEVNYLAHNAPNHFLEKDTLILEKLDKLDELFGDSCFIKLLPMFLIERDYRDCIASYWHVIKHNLGMESYVPLSKVVERYNKARQNTIKYYSCFDYIVNYQDLLFRPQACIQEAFNSLKIPFNSVQSRNKKLHNDNEYMKGVEKDVDNTRQVGDSFYQYLTEPEQNFVLNYAIDS